MTLKSQLEELSRSFAAQIIEALHSASLHELGTTGRAVAGQRRNQAPAAEGGSRAAPKTGKNGRLRRRSPEEIAKTLDKIVLLVKTHKNGLRAEEIRSRLGMQAREMPRILKEGIAKKKLTSKGHKRATTYLAR
jgi:hypothetical protein